jgi:hypothetical protein
MKKEVKEEDVFRMYMTIGSGNYGSNSYQNTKEKLLNRELFENNDGSKVPLMIDPTKVKVLAERIVEEMLSGFIQATKEHTNDNELRGNFVMVHDVMKRKMSLFMNTFAGDASDELGFMYKFANDSEREIYSTKVDNFVARFAWMVLQHIVSFSNMVGSDSYLETAKKQEQKSQETKISKHQHEVKETRPVQQREETRPVQQRDVYFEFRKNIYSLQCWQQIEGFCPTDSLYLVVGDILQFCEYSREAGTSLSRINKFKLRITNLTFRSTSETASLLILKIMTTKLKLKRLILL